MNKSIYEEAKRDLISLTAKFVIPSVEETDYGCLYDSVHFYNTLDEQEEKYYKTVEQALEKAQKQERLLKLYKELTTVRNDMISTLSFVTSDYYAMEKKETNIEKQISELENE